jgi:hypothetical protein
MNTDIAIQGFGQYDAARRKLERLWEQMAVAAAPSTAEHRKELALKLI